MLKLILASNSPRRKHILEMMGLNFDIIPSNYDEHLENDIFSYEKIEDLATQKCLDVVKRVDSNSVVLAADTVVVLHNKILGKPHTKDIAYKMLKELSGNVHSVVTSICCINTKLNFAATLSTTSYVKFTDWTDEMINFYVNTFNPIDKAGSYGIQELPEGYLEKYEGSFDNIIGLSAESVTAILKKVKYIDKC